MNKKKFLQLKELFDEYKACEEALDKLQNTKQYVEREHSRTLSLFKIEIGTFRTSLDPKEGVNVEGMKPVVLELVERMTAYYEQRMIEIDRTIEQA